MKKLLLALAILFLPLSASAAFNSRQLSTTTATNGYCLTTNGSDNIWGSCGSGLSGGTANLLPYWVNATTLGATSSPTVGYITATSTTLSTFGTPTANVKIGTFQNGSNNYAGMYFNQSAPDSLNYGFLGNSTDTYLNGSSGVHLRVNNTNEVLTGTANNVSVPSGNKLIVGALTAGATLQSNATPTIGSYSLSNWNNRGYAVPLFAATPISDGGSTPTTTFPGLVIGMEGTAGQAYPQFAEFKIGRSANVSTNAKTQLDIALTAGDAAIAGTNVMTLLSEGVVNVVKSIGIATTTTTNAALYVQSADQVSPSTNHGAAASMIFRGGVPLEAAFGEDSSTNVFYWQNRHANIDAQTYPISLNPLGGGVQIGYDILNNGEANGAGLIVKDYVGIGTTSPYAPLSVNGQAVAAYFTATTSTASQLPYASTTLLTIGGVNATPYSYRSFTLATTTAWTGTSTPRFMAVGAGETVDALRCATDVGTTTVSILVNGSAAKYFVSTSTPGVIAPGITLTSAATTTVSAGNPAGSPTQVVCTLKTHLNSVAW